MRKKGPLTWKWEFRVFCLHGRALWLPSKGEHPVFLPAPSATRSVKALGTLVDYWEDRYPGLQMGMESLLLFVAFACISFFISKVFCFSLRLFEER